MHPISSHRLNVRCHFLNTFTHQCMSTTITFVNKQQILFIHWYANNLCLSRSKVLVNEVITTAKDVLPNKPHSGRRNHPLAAMEWSRLLLHDITCSDHVTMRHAAEQTIASLPGWGTGLMKVHNVLCPWLSGPLTLTFKLVRARDQTRLPCEFGANPLSGSRDIWFTNKDTKKSQSALKTEPYAFYCVH